MDTSVNAVTVTVMNKPKGATPCSNDDDFRLQIWKTATSMDRAHTDMLLTFGALRLDTIPGQRLNETERRKLKAEYAQLPIVNTTVNGKSTVRKKKGCVARLRWDWGINDPHYLNRIVKQDLILKTGDHGKKRVYTYKFDNPADDAAFKWALCTQTKETGLRALLARYNMRTGQNKSYSEFWRKKQRYGVKNKKRKTTSTLKYRHEIGRMLFATEHLQCTMDLWFHADEKNWQTHNVGRGFVYVCEKFMTQKYMRTLCTQKLHSKRHITWVMIYAAVGKPIRSLGFDGKLFIHWVSKPYNAKKDSKYHKKSDRFDVKANYDAEMDIFLGKKLLQRVTTVFKGNLPPGSTVHILRDGAGPHSKQVVAKRLEKLGAKNIPRVVWHTQEAQSPILNLDDLMVFNHLASNTAQRDYKNKEELVDGIWKAWDELTPVMLERCVATWRGVLRELVVNKGSYIKVPRHGVRAAQYAYALDDWMDELMNPETIQIKGL